MKNEIRVSELIRGLQGINRMRGEIDLIVSGLTGRMRKVLRPSEIKTVFGGKPAEVGIQFNEDHVMWKVCMSCVHAHPFVVECRDMRSYSLVFSNLWKNEADEISLEHVEFVHESLQVLVDGIFDTFPRLREDAEQVHKAALKFPECRS